MKLVQTLYLLKIIFTVGAVPITGNEKPNLPDEDDLRDKRSSFTIPYISPCAASSLPSIVPPGYHLNLPPVQQYVRPQTYNNYNYPRYRSIVPNEMQMLSMDMNHITQNAPVGMEGMPSNPSKPGLTILNSQAGPQHMPHMGAVGVFPYANPEPMHVPLLFACTPSILQGQVMHQQAQYHNGYRSDAYRDTDLEYLYEPSENESQPEYSPNPQKPDNVAVKPQ